MNMPKKSAIRIGIGGPVGAGKTTLTAALVKELKNLFSVAVITNDIYTQEDAEALLRLQILPEDRIIGVETGGCPHNERYLHAGRCRSSFTSADFARG